MSPQGAIAVPECVDGKRILIADHQDDHRELLMCLLESRGYTVITARDGQEALALALEQPPSAVIAAVGMPFMDGFELCRCWHADPQLRRVPMLLCSSHDIASDKEQLGLSLGARHYFYKPIEADELVGILRKVIDAAPMATESEDRLRRVLASLQEVVWASSMSGQLEYLSPAVETVYGLTHESCLADPNFWLNAVLPEDRPIAEASGRQVLDCGSSDVEYRIRQPDGEVRWLRDRKAVVRNGSVVVGISGVAIDITDQRKAQAELHIVERAVESASHGIIVCDARDPSLPIVSVNAAFLKMTGYDRSEVLGRNCRLLQGTDQDQPQRHEIAEAIRHEREVSVTLRNYRKDGQQFLNQVSIAPVHDMQGTLTHFVGFQQDITRRTVAEAELVELREEMASIARLNTISEMAAGIAHEVNQPISAIANYAAAAHALLSESHVERSDRDSERADEAMAYITKVKELAHDVGSIVRRMRDFNQRGRVMTSVSMQQMVDETLDMISHRIKVRQIPIKREFPTEPIVVNVDNVQIKQVIINLVQNGIDAVVLSGNTSAGLTLSLESVEGQASLLVTDYGDGIPDERTGRLFESSPSSKPHGSGIGLAISARIIGEHGGEISGWNNPERGATFRVALPLSKESGL